MLADSMKKRGNWRLIVVLLALGLIITGIILLRRKSDAGITAKKGNKIIRYGTGKFDWSDQKSAPKEDADVPPGQLVPEFGELPRELFPGNRPFSLDFHQLPTDYLMPQSPEAVRTTMENFNRLKTANKKALLSQQELAERFAAPQEQDSDENL